MKVILLTVVLIIKILAFFLIFEILVGQSSLFPHSWYKHGNKYLFMRHKDVSQKLRKGWDSADVCLHCYGRI